MTGRLFDISLGMQFDLTSKVVRSRIERDALRGLLVAACLAPPCTSFSAQQRGKLRSLPWPWSKPGLSPERQEKVRVGNLLARSALALIRVFHRCRIPSVLEHPHASFLWHTPQVVRLRKLASVRFIFVDHCAFGSPHRKRTGLLFGHCDHADIEALAECRCHSSDGICDFSGERHVILLGCFLTPRSQAYPPVLLRNLSDVLLHDVLHRRTIA